MLLAWRPWLAGVLLCLGTAAHGHSFHAGITDIAFNARTGSIELVHTYTAHDLETLLTNLYQRPFDLADQDDARLLRKYLEKQFYLIGTNQQRLPLTWVGVKVDAESVIIYQEVLNTPLAGAALIHDAVLSDFLAEQTNTVNINRSGAVQTLTFDRAHVEQRLP